MCSESVLTIPVSSLESSASVEPSCGSVRMVFLMFVVQENNHGRVGDAIGTRVIDAYSVRHAIVCCWRRRSPWWEKRLRESFPGLLESDIANLCGNGQRDGGVASPPLAEGGAADDSHLAKAQKASNQSVCRGGSVHVDSRELFHTVSFAQSESTT
jgi:hypothetical protein